MAANELAGLVRSWRRVSNPRSRSRIAMARLTHPHVVAVYDVGLHGDDVFIVMEYVDGVTLREWWRQKPRSLDDILRVFAEAGRGLVAAHAAGLATSTRG
jgi:serine/threonine protein kinase